MDAQKIAQRLYESFVSDDLCEHPEIVDDVEDLADEYEDTKAENAELVDMLGELYWCSRQLGCDRGASRECCVTLKRMREMGIEVSRE